MWQVSLKKCLACMLVTWIHESLSGIWKTNFVYLELFEGIISFEFMFFYIGCWSAYGLTVNCFSTSVIYCVNCCCWVGWFLSSFRLVWVFFEFDCVGTQERVLRFCECPFVIDRHCQFPMWMRWRLRRLLVGEQ